MFYVFSGSENYQMRKRREEDNFSMVKTIIIAVCSAVAYLAVVIGLTVYCSIRLVKAKNMRKQYVDMAPVIASKYGLQYDRVPSRTGKHGKWEVIFQSGNSQGILNRLDREKCTKYWKDQKFLTNVIYYFY